MDKKERIFFEEFSPNYIRGFKIDRLLYEGKTKYQRVKLIENELFGKVLFLDDKIQSAQIDERIYHEALVHPAMMTHPKPQKVLVLGGGEGATVREILKHSTVKEITMVDIDEELVQICRKHLPEWSEGAFNDPKTKLIYGDARRFISQTTEKFDVIISDLTEPLEGSPSKYLFTKEFYAQIIEILSPKGVFVIQSGSADPLYHEFFSSCVKTVECIFPVTRPYWTYVFSFGVPWGFLLGSKTEDPSGLSESDLEIKWRDRGLSDFEFYRPGLHAGLFALPVYLEKGIGKGKVLTDAKPYIWRL